MSALLSPKLIIAGAPASGKGTQCELIKDKYGVIHLSTGDILRAAVSEGTDLGNLAKGYMDRGELVPDSVIIGVIKDRLLQTDCGEKGWLLDGFPRTKKQADALTELGVSPDKFLLLDVPDEMLVERVIGRRTDPVTGKIYHLKYFPPANDEVAGRLVQRSDDTEEKIKVRIDAFKANTAAVENSYKDKLLILDGTRPKEAVFADIVKSIEGLRPKKTNVTSGTGSSKAGPLVSTASLAAFILADTLLRRAFSACKIAFPSSLSGMMAFFVALVAMERFAPSAAAKTVAAATPGANILTLWLPVFFVPSLITLPLAPPLTSAVLGRLTVLISVGYLASLVSTAAVVKTLRRSSSANGTLKAGSVVTAKPFSRSLLQAFWWVAAYSGAVATGLARSGAALSIPLTTLSMGCATLGSFVAGTKLPANFKKVVHPLITCTGVTLGWASILAIARGCAWKDLLRSYVTRSRCPIHLGAGDLLLGLLGPSILSFAIQMHSRRQLMADNAPAVAGGTLYAAASGLFGTALLARVLALPPALRLATLPRQITSPLAMAVAACVGADAGMAVALVVVTGVIGANFGPGLLDAMKVEDPVVRGLAQGASAHGLGTAGIASEPSAFPFAAISMALTATVSTILVSIPALKTLLLKAALGAGGL